MNARFVEMFGDAVDNPMGWEKKQLQEIVTDDCTISYGIVQTGNDQEEECQYSDLLILSIEFPSWKS